MDPWQTRTGTAPKTYIRKAAYEYGWDWGPRFVTSGISRPVRVEVWDKVRIADFAIRQRDVSREAAHIDAEVTVEASSNSSAQISIQYAGLAAPLTKAATLHTFTATSSTSPSKSGNPNSGILHGYGDQTALRVHRTRLYCRPNCRQAHCENRPPLHRPRSASRQVGPQLPVSREWHSRLCQGRQNVIPFGQLLPIASPLQTIAASSNPRAMPTSNMIRHWGGGYYRDRREFYPNLRRTRHHGLAGLHVRQRLAARHPTDSSSQWRLRPKIRSAVFATTPASASGAATTRQKSLSNWSSAR